MKHISCLSVFILGLCIAPLFAQVAPFSPPNITLQEQAWQREQQEVQRFLDAIPRRLEFPEKDLKTYIIDKETFNVVHTLDGYLREYWADLDIILTETEHTIYIVDGKETNVKPEGQIIFIQDIDHTERTVVTLWNRATGEKLRSVICDRAFSGGDDSPLRIIQRKALLWSAKTRTTAVVDLVTGESLETLPGSVRYVAKDESFLMSQERGNVVIREGKTLTPLCKVPGGTVRLTEDMTRFITWADITEDATVYELKTGKKIASVPKGKDSTFNRAGTMVLIRHAYQEIELWNIDTGEKCWSVPFDGDAQDNYWFRFSDDGKIVTGCCQPRLPIYPKDYPRTGAIPFRASFFPIWRTNH